MIFLILLIFTMGFIEIRGMIKQKLYREIWIYSIIALLACGLGIFYLSDPFRTGFSVLLMGILGIKY